MAKKSILSSIDITSLVNAMKLVFPVREETHQIIKDEIKHLPSKDDFYTRMDTLTKEVKDMREIQELHIDDHDRLDKRLGVVEKRLHLSTIVD